MPIELPPGATPQAFTRRYNRSVRVLTTPIHIGPAMGAGPSIQVPPPDGPELTAVWDTGATSSAISKGVAKQAGLTAVSMAVCKTGAGEVVCPVHHIRLYLPNHVCIPQLEVMELDIAVDALIGMDVIGSSDFAVTNLEDRAVLSFRMPSISLVDFVRETKELSPNRPCPCQSGRKYKHCHGK